MIRERTDLLKRFKGKDCKVYLLVSDPVAYHCGVITEMDDDGIIMDCNSLVVYITGQDIASVEMMK